MADAPHLRALRRAWKAAVPARLRTKAHLRLQARRRGRPVRLGDLNRTTPIERHLGRTRGGPVDRHYIAAFLDRNRADIRGHVLEVADPGYVERFGDGVTRVDVLDVDPANERATIVADVTDLAGVADGTFDCIVFTQVLQLVYDARAAMRSLERVLAPGGVLLATLPGIHPSPPGKGDYWSFTASSARRLAEEAFGPDVEVEGYGNVLVAAGFLYGLGEDDFDRETLEVHDPAFDVTIAVRAVKRSRDA